MFAPLIATLVLSLGIGTAVAADRSKPGDTLFPVDRALEHLRLTLSLTDDARVRQLERIAVERERESTEVEAEHVAKPEDRLTTEQAKGAALEGALKATDDLRTELKTKGKEPEAEKIQRVTSRLNDLKTRHQDRVKAFENGLTEAEATVTASGATVTIEFNNAKSRFTLTASDEASIVRTIAERTGVSEAAVRAVLKIEREQDEDENEDESVNANSANTNRDDGDEDEDRDDIRNTNAGTNGNLNANTNSGRNETQSWEIEVRVKNGQAKIKAKQGATRLEWSLSTTVQATILADVVAKTGLTTATVQSTWDYESE